MTVVPLRDNDALEQALSKRGVNPELAAWIVLWMAGDAIERTLRWYDAQDGRVGPGVLVDELKAGGRPVTREQRQLDEQRRYGREVLAWLDRHMPELDRHPAAAWTVIRLHYRHGKTALSLAAHGPAIRAAVADFDERFGTGETPKEGES